MNTVSAKWIKCTSGNWCSLESLKLETVSGNGVYIIWHDGNPGRVVRVGQGVVADRLYEHQRDLAVLAYRKYGTLRVTWAALPASQWDGVERYLGEMWEPLVGDRFPDAVPIAVNSPWG